MTYNNRNDRSGPRHSPPQPPPEIRPMPLPDDYVEAAEAVIRSFLEDNPNAGKRPSCISTSKLRNLLTLSTAMYNRETIRTGDAIAPQTLADISQMRIRTAYECGRDYETKRFVERAKLLQHLKWLSESRQRRNVIDFAHYMEALVAYHRYYGLKGKED